MGYGTFTLIRNKANVCMVQRKDDGEKIEIRARIWYWRSSKLAKFNRNFN